LARRPRARAHRLPFHALPPPTPPGGTRTTRTSPSTSRTAWTSTGACVFVAARGGGEGNVLPPSPAVPAPPSPPFAHAARPRVGLHRTPQGVCAGGGKGGGGVVGLKKKLGGGQRRPRVTPLSLDLTLPFPLFPAQLRPHDAGRPVQDQGRAGPHAGVSAVVPVRGGEKREREGGKGTGNTITLETNTLPPDPAPPLPFSCRAARASAAPAP
jgi:hypothetical protein